MDSKEKQNVWRNKCINPFKKEKHNKRTSLCSVSQSLRDKYPDLPEGSKICKTCQFEFSKLTTKVEIQFANEKNSQSIDEKISLPLDNEDFIFDENLESDNDSDFVIKNKKQKLESCNNDYCKAGITTLNQIKERFFQSKSISDRIFLLTLAPKDWGRKKLMKEFNSTEWEAKSAIALVKEHGILSHPNKKKGKVLPEETVISVKKFYERDDVSRLMPGKNDFVSIKQNN